MAINSLKNALLFIPDISGFTKFVNETETVHGAHIVAELLEIIIENNTIGLTVAEIEGDAILFYKNGEKSNIKEIYDQCEKMFLAFHQHLKLYNRDRICDCGACTNASELTLKFVVHYGEILERDISGHFQLMGADVTTAHKLMKNNIPKHEYVLISENSVIESKELPGWVNLESTSDEYENVGTINYQYSYLSGLLKKVPEAPKRRDSITIQNPTVLKKEIDCNIENAYQLLVNLERKPEWVDGLKRIKFDKNQIERIGTTHQCVLPLNSLNVETTKNEVFEDNMIYAETVDSSGIFPAFTQMFVIKHINSSRCELSVEIHHKSSFLKKFIFEMIIVGSIKKSLISFKAICEKENISLHN